MTAATLALSVLSLGCSTYTLLTLRKLCRTAVEDQVMRLSNEALR